MFQIHVHTLGIGRYTYTCIHVGTQMTKVKKTEQCVATVGMVVGRYLALPYGFSLSGWVVQVVFPRVHVLVCWLVLHGILHNR